VQPWSEWCSSPAFVERRDKSGGRDRTHTWHGHEPAHACILGRELFELGVGAGDLLAQRLEGDE
jgi:hypothetical protein